MFTKKTINQQEQTNLSEQKRVLSPHEIAGTQEPMKLPEILPVQQTESQEVKVKVQNSTRVSRAGTKKMEKKVAVSDDRDGQPFIGLLLGIPLTGIFAYGTYLITTGNTQAVIWALGGTAVLSGAPFVLGLAAASATVLFGYLTIKLIFKKL